MPEFAIDVDEVVSPAGHLCRVRTVRLRLNSADPLDAALLAAGELWATMVWDPEVEDGAGLEVRRYTSETAALAGHKAVCQEIVHDRAVVRV